MPGFEGRFTEFVRRGLKAGFCGSILQPFSLVRLRLRDGRLLMGVVAPQMEGLLSLATLERCGS